MKILHIAEKISGGGAESVFNETIKSLNDAFPDKITNWVACIGGTSSNANISLDFGDSPKSKLGEVVSQIYSRKNYRLLTVFLANHHPDVIHVQMYGNLSSAILRALWHYKRRKPEVTIIHTAHTFEYACSHFAGYDYRKKKVCLDCAASTYKFRIFYRGCSRAGFMHSWGKGIGSLISNYYINKHLFDSIITPSNFLQKIIEQRDKKLCNISVLRNPLSNELIDRSNNQLAQFGKSCITKEANIVYFGRFSAEKNIECLIKAFYIFQGQIEGARLLLIGNGDEKEGLMRLVEQLGLFDKVSFKPFLPQKDLYQVLSKGHIAVLPSKCLETASLLVPEAAMNNLIPVVANHGGMKEMVEWIGAGRTFESNNEQDLAAVLYEIVNSYEEYSWKLLDATDKCKKLLNSKHYADELYQLYQTALDK
jgi:glycosyltransferase involved in cell wall biosynthesis